MYDGGFTVGAWGALTRDKIIDVIGDKLKTVQAYFILNFESMRDRSHFAQDQGQWQV